MTKDTKDRFQYYFGATIMVLLFINIGLLYFKEIPKGNASTIYLTIGIVLGWGSMIVGWFFQSTKGSSDKTEMLANSTPLPTSSVTTSITNATTVDNAQDIIK